MYGFFVGDIIGNSYTHENEKYNKKTKDFELFTSRSKFSDDTILSFATIKWLLSKNHTPQNMQKLLKQFYKKYPDKNPTIYGPEFVNWVTKKNNSYRRSRSNNGAMRSSVIGWYCNDIESIKKLSYNATLPTNNTPEGLKGAEAVAVAIYLLKNGMSLKELKNYFSKSYKYKLNMSFSTYKKQYKYSANAKETIRPALFSLLYSTDYEDAIRNAVSFGGDTDTITTITSALAEAYYKKIPETILSTAISFLPKEFIKLLNRLKNISKTNKLLNQYKLYR